MQAQQQFAKKVKEAAVLEEQNEEYEESIQNLQQIITQNKVKIAELQTGLDLQTQQQRKIQEQLQEALKAAENAHLKWEEKYFTIYQKLQEAELKIKELEKIEEKQKHLQGILSNLGTFFNAPVTSESVLKEKEPEPVKAVELPKPPAPEKIRESGKSLTNLFNMPKPPGRPRQSFLE
jgi:chromosome segregation ATPase